MIWHLNIAILAKFGLLGLGIRAMIQMNWLYGIACAVKKELPLLHTFHFVYLFVSFVCFVELLLPSTAVEWTPNSPCLPDQDLFSPPLWTFHLQSPPQLPQLSAVCQNYCYYYCCYCYCYCYYYCYYYHYYLKKLLKKKCANTHMRWHHAVCAILNKLRLWCLHCHLVHLLYHVVHSIYYDVNAIFWFYPCFL